MKKLAIALALLSTTAFAADQTPQAVKAPAYANPCTVTQCSGFYIGGDVAGIGSNADILGSGINGSIFAGGAELGGHVGYQFWNGSLFGAFQVGGSYDTGGSTFITNFTGASVKPGSLQYVFRGGYGLNNLFGTAPAAPAQGPVTVFQQLASSQISPFFEVGGETRNFGSGFISGGGIEYVIGPHWTAVAVYEHVNFNQTVNSAIPISIGTINRVKAELNYKF